MRRLLAIAGLAVRASIRSRLVVALLALLLTTVIALPLNVQSDGTPEGHVRLVIGYTMGLASLLLSLTALWSGALSIAREVDEKQIQMVCSKPVHRLEIWLGKWLGLTAVHAALWLLCGLATLLFLRASLAGDRFTDEQRAVIHQEVLTAWRVVKPRPVEVESAARATWEQRLQSGETPRELAPAQLLQNIRQELLARAHTIGPGEKMTWTFDLPAHLQGDADLRLKFKFSSSRLGGEPARGTWMAGPATAPSLFRAATTNAAEVVHRLTLPRLDTARSATLVVSYINDDPEPFTLFFAPSTGLEVQGRAGAFLPNFARAALLIAIQLGLLVAIGVTASTLFSTPVAALMALAAAIVLRAADFISSLARQETFTSWSSQAQTGPGLLDALLRTGYRALDFVLAPLQTGRPLDQVATGVWIDPLLVARTGVVHLLVYGALLAALATWVFNRRELAQPST